MSAIIQPLDSFLRRVFFRLQYSFNDPPWDTGISPPELMEFLQTHEPGRALDLGCGTGTNAVTLAEHGWQVVGVDFVRPAIRSARRKARRAEVREQTAFYRQDVLALDNLSRPFQLILDIGCFHSLGGEEVGKYAQNLHRLLDAGGTFLLYAHLKTDGGVRHGASEADLTRVTRGLQKVYREDGTEGGSRPSSWLHYVKPGGGAMPEGP